MDANERRQHATERTDGGPAVMTDWQRHDRPMAWPETALLDAFLDFPRDTLLWKVSGLTEEQLRKVWTPSGMSLLGLVKHLAYVERNWFQNRFLGRDLPV